MLLNNANSNRMLMYNNFQTASSHPTGVGSNLNSNQKMRISLYSGGPGQNGYHIASAHQITKSPQVKNKFRREYGLGRVDTTAKTHIGSSINNISMSLGLQTNSRGTLLSSKKQRSQGHHNVQPKLNRYLRQKSPSNAVNLTAINPSSINNSMIYSNTNIANVSAFNSQT